MSIHEILWLFLGALLGLVFAGAVACVFLGVGSLLKLRRERIRIAPATTRRPTGGHSRA